MENIEFDELKNYKNEQYVIIDIRDELSFEYGHMNNSINIPMSKLEDDYSMLDNNNKMLVICCKSGIISDDVACKLRSKGYNAVNLAGGYYSWLREQFSNQNISPKVEDSLQTEFHDTIWMNFEKAICEYKLVNPGDRIAVCISGGKDSMLLAKLFAKLKSQSEIPFEVKYLVMDPGYNFENREIIENNAQKLSIPITVFESNIFDYVYKLDRNSCFMCAKMRRGYLYKNAQDLGCNKIALGHHYDDVIETILMGMIYGGQVQTMMPKLHSLHYKGLELIRPLYFTREDEIKRWRDYNDLHFIQCACRFTDTCTTCNPSETGSKRQEIKHLIKTLKQSNPDIENNIFNSIYNINLNRVIQFKDNKYKHDFLDFYNEYFDDEIF